MLLMDELDEQCIEVADSSEEETDGGNRPPKCIKSESTKIPQAAQPHEGEEYNGMIASHQYEYTPAYAFQHAHLLNQCCQMLLNDSESECLFPKLNCPECTGTSGSQQIITVFDSDYYECCCHTECWFETDFVRSFTTMMAHLIHKPLVLYIAVSSYENEIIDVD
jgi:hypothetical protein